MAAVLPEGASRMYVLGTHAHELWKAEKLRSLFEK
jgi:hypothetical protein